ncbi:Root phototropism protein 3 [Hibiscus syriacus]|uniref:Root phototropism protein 3 n=1 Tax=Hibiscus syriacus TaxID=106335 RepID=A0A6A3A2P3_HIBSY|nr:Root phototropism protein 3 [Hibiscus syriacus]
MWESETESARGREFGNGFQLKGQSWYVATDIPSDLLVQVGDVNFHIHKYPLLSRSGKMNRFVYDWKDRDLDKFALEDLPGGPEVFALATKFCYGIAVDLTAENISGLGCAAEYLEMTEDFEEGNLIFKTEAFLSYVVLSSWRDSIVVLKNCEELSPWAENLQIARRCIGTSSSSDWWFEDVSILRIDHFVRVITAIKAKGMRLELIGAAIMHYTARWLPCLITNNSEVQADGMSMSSRSNKKESVSCSFLLRLLQTANMLKVAPALVTELEKGCWSISLSRKQTDGSSPSRRVFSDKHIYEGTQRGNNRNVVDSYLTEVSRDRNLSMTKFQVLAEALPESARTCDDGLYRAIDSYLKAHPTLSEHERKRLCRVMDCQKLSIDACMHAAQNERLPLRVVVQGQPLIPNRKTLLEGTPQSFQEGWTAAKKDINTLKFELESVKSKYVELQQEMDNLQRQFDKMSKPKQTSAWSSGWKETWRFAKMTTFETTTWLGISTADEHAEKTPRRWRNSIS